ALPAPTAPLTLPTAPVIDAASKWTADGIVVSGNLQGQPNQTYAIEIFVSHTADKHTGDESGWGEGERYLATASARTDATGKGGFSLSMRLADPFGDGQLGGYVTATSTDADGSTSKFSRAV